MSLKTGKPLNIKNLKEWLNSLFFHIFIATMSYKNFIPHNYTYQDMGNHLYIICGGFLNLRQEGEFIEV